MQYHATSCQIALESCFDGDAGFDPRRVARNLEHAEEFLRACHRVTPSRLYLLPEFSIQGWSPGRSVADWCAASTPIPGPETARIGALARELDAYVAGTLFESIAEFPGRYFLTGFLIAPDARVVLRYRKLYAFSAKTRPGDVYRRWVELYGREGLFPVIATPLGRVGMVIAWDALWPETTRALALRGAEVILHPMASPRLATETGTAFDCYRRVRAFENATYLVSANFGPLDSTAGQAPHRWPSEIIDYEGRCLAATNGDGECSVSARIDLAALRAHRARPGRNWLAQLQPALHAPDYAEAGLWPLSRWEDRPLASPREFLDLEAEVRRGMRGSGRFE